MGEVLRELTDIELSDVFGGQIVFAIGAFASTTTSAVVGVQANTGFNGGVGSGNVAIGNDAAFVGNDFS